MSLEAKLETTIVKVAENVGDLGLRTLDLQADIAQLADRVTDQASMLETLEDAAIGLAKSGDQVETKMNAARAQAGTARSVVDTSSLQLAAASHNVSELIDQVKELRTILGTMAGAHTGWLLLRSLETLKLRMTCQMKNARYVADFLADHPKVRRVHYLGHLKEGEPQWALYRKMCSAPGSVISFELVGGEAECFRMLNHLELVKLAVSLGGTESLAQHPATMTHADVPADTQAEIGVTPALIRLSVGVEHPEDLIADLEHALSKV